jgi:hypothetical protein
MRVMKPGPYCYVGSAEYCYSNAASMLLASIGETVEPSVVECLTAVGAGARYCLADGMAYFSNRPPDLGLTNALDALGFDVQENTLDENTAPPLATLRRFLEGAPVLIGPLDMQHLTYLPRHRDTPGADHYALVTDATARASGYTIPRVTRMCGSARRTSGRPGEHRRSPTHAAPSDIGGFRADAKSSMTEHSSNDASTHSAKPTHGWTSPAGRTLPLALGRSSSQPSASSQAVAVHWRTC